MLPLDYSIKLFNTTQTHNYKKTKENKIMTNKTNKNPNHGKRGPQKKLTKPELFNRVIQTIADITEVLDLVDPETLKPKELLKYDSTLQKLDFIIDNSLDENGHIRFRDMNKVAFDAIKDDVKDLKKKIKEI